jgi:ABC-type Mn2+/Zn2+ transport system permease subunit
MLVGGLAVVAGLLLSYHLQVATGPAIAGLAVLGFFLVLAATEFRDRVASLRAARSPTAA